MSIISVGELQAGVLLASDAAIRARRLQRLTALLAGTPVVVIDAAVAARYGELRAAASGEPSNDPWPQAGRIVLPVRSTAVR